MQSIYSDRLFFPCSCSCVITHTPPKKIEIPVRFWCFLNFQIPGVFHFCVCPVFMNLDLHSVVVLRFQFLEVLLPPNLLLLSLAPVIKRTYHNHNLWFLWLEYKNIKLLLSSNCPGQQLCNKILTFNDHSCTLCKFYWAQVHDGPLQHLEKSLIRLERKLG